MFPSSRSHQHEPPLLGRVRVANKFPGVKALMQLSDFLASFGRDFGSPCQRPTSVGQTLVLPIDSATGTCACGRASFGDGLPALRSTGSPEERQGPPRLRGHPLRTCRGATLRRTQPRLAHFSLRSSLVRSTSPSRKTERSASGMLIVFEAKNPRPIRSRAYASPASLPRPSPGSLPARAGSPLAGQNSHLQDNERNFMETSQILQSQSTSRAWSHLFDLRPKVS